MKTFTITLITSQFILGFFGKWTETTKIVGITHDDFNNGAYKFKTVGNPYHLANYTPSIPK